MSTETETVSKKLFTVDEYHRFELIRGEIQSRNKQLESKPWSPDG
jgi:hypothetical protein